MLLEDKLKEAKREIIIVGVLPVEEFFIRNRLLFADKIRKNNNFKITVFHESESVLFNRSLALDTRYNKSNRISFKELKNKITRMQRFGSSFMFRGENNEYKDFCEDRSQYEVKQLNLWYPSNIIVIDDEYYLSHVLLNISKFDDYRKIEEKDLEDCIKSYIDYIRDKKAGGLYNSKPDDEMIEMYDRDDIPRGIFPRKSFYNTNSQRYSVWLFVFNRNGQLLLQKRSTNPNKVKDNGGLWDKSAGGHVDIEDRSSANTAVRELVEEMYMHDAEYSSYIMEKTNNFINLGEFYEAKREEEQVLNIFKRLSDVDYGYFFLKDSSKRTSKRVFVDWKDHSLTSKEIINEHDNVNGIDVKETKFISDIYLFVSPLNELNNEADLIKMNSTAVCNRRLIEVQDLIDEIEDAKENQTAIINYTDDLLYIVDDLKEVLLGFSDYIKQVFINSNER